MEIDDIFKDAVLERLGGKYLYNGYLGGGAFSNVYQLRHKFLKEDHALKIMKSKHVLKKFQKEDVDQGKKKFEEIKQRFINEATFYKKISHPNIAKIYDVDVFSEMKVKIEILFMIMRYIKGPTLKMMLKGVRYIEFDKVLKITKGILDALKAIHQYGIVHRDLKPDNVIVELGIRPILIDFGLAKDLLSNTNLTSTGRIMGTPLYMSPEQFNDSSKAGHKSDIYSVGVMIFEMLTGEPPFKGKDMIEIMKGHCYDPVPDVSKKNPGLPTGIGAIVRKAMEKSPENRFQNAEEMMNNLKKFE